MANCLDQLGRYSEAIENYQSFLRESSNLKPTQRAEIAKTIERLSRHFGTVDVQLSPADAQLTVDGRQATRNASGALIVATGEHVLRAELEGYNRTRRIVQVEGGSNQALELQLEPISATAPIAPLVGSSEPVPAAEPVQAYVAEADQPSSGPKRVWLWTAGGAAALLTVGFVTAAGLTYKAQGDFDHSVDISSDTAQPLTVRNVAYADAEDAKDKAERLALVSDLLLGGAVVATGATVVFWLMGRRHGDQPTARLDAQLLLQRHVSGLSLRGQF